MYPIWMPAAFVSIGIFLLVQAGSLIWILSRINTELKNINIVLKRGHTKFDQHEAAINLLEKRIVRLEERIKK